MIVAVCLMAGLEMDRLLAISGNKQTAQLKAGFKGIQAANSSNVSDAKRIHKDTIGGLRSQGEATIPQLMMMMMIMMMMKMMTDDD